MTPDNLGFIEWIVGIALAIVLGLLGVVWKSQNSRIDELAVEVHGAATKEEIEETASRVEHSRLETAARLEQARLETAANIERNRQESADRIEHNRQEARRELREDVTILHGKIDELGRELRTSVNQAAERQTEIMFTLAQMGGGLLQRRPARKRL